MLTKCRYTLNTFLIDNLISQNDMTFHLVTHVDEVLEAAFDGGLPLPSSRVKVSPSSSSSTQVSSTSKL